MDWGSRYTEHRLKILDSKLRRVYRQAEKEIQGELDQFTEKKKKRNDLLLKKLDDGEITEQQYKDWLAGQAFMEKQWKMKQEQVTASLLHANEEALAIVRGEQLNVFAENANHQAYEIEQDFMGAYSFNIYDKKTVENLLTNDPELLPPRKINGRKDRAWNQGIINNCVTQGIIQGESIDKITKRIAKDTASKDMKAMRRYARTAMTSAQNAGRMEMLKRAHGMGIKVQKEWLATLDGKTRDSHRKLDGEVQDVNKPFQGEFSKIMFPGDPSAHPAEVYNCRCTLTYVYPDYQKYETDQDWRQREEIDGQSYEEWKEGKVRIHGSQDRPILKYLQPQYETEEDHKMALFNIKKIQGEHSIMDDAKAVNPLYDPNNFATSQNCQRCVNAYVARRRGYDVKARGIFSADDHYAIGNNFKDCYDTDEKAKHLATSIFEKGLTPEIVNGRLEDEMMKLPDGAISIVSGYWEITDTGHVFIAEKHNGGIIYVDPQNGKECSGYWEWMQPKSMYWFNTTGKPFNNKIAELVEGV